MADNFKENTKSERDYETETFWEMFTAMIKVFAVGGSVIFLTNIIVIIYQTCVINNEGTADIMLVKLIPGIMLILLCLILLMLANKN